MQQRYHGLDALRAFALLLGIVFHAAESFCPERYSWAIVDRFPHVVYAVFQHTCHSFRMEIFFLIAGFFGNLVLQRRGFSGFIIHRTRRILVPLIVGWILIYPAMVSIWIWGKSASGRLGDLGIPSELQSFPVWKLSLGFFLNLEFIGENFSLTHLWFLYYLLMLYGLILAIRWLFSTFTPSSLLDSLDSLVRWTLGGWWSVPVLSAVTVPLIFPMNGVETPNETLVPDLPVLLVYGLFFGLGWLIYRQPILLTHFRVRWGWHLLLGLLLVIPTFFPEEILRELGFRDNWAFGHYVAYNSMYALMMWSFVAGFSGFFLTYFRSESRIWRYIADSSYWLYLVHLLIVVPLQILVADWAVPSALKYLIINLVALPVLILSYHYLARSTFIGQQLNGRQYPFRPLLSRRTAPRHRNRIG